jgi:hypothetical protein
MTAEKKPRAPRRAIGLSIQQAAAALDVPPRAMRRAVDLKEIETVQFAGVRRIPPREIARIRRELIDAAE